MSQPCTHVKFDLIRMWEWRRQVCGLHPDQLGTSNSAMPCQDAAVLINQDRIGEAKLRDTISDLPDLFLGVYPRLADPRFEIARLSKR